MGSRLAFRCASCGAEYANYVVRCGCGEWGSSRKRERRMRPASVRGSRVVGFGQEEGQPARERMLTGIEPWDVVLGGGMVPVSSVLLVGSPGVGKSTLALQAAEKYAEKLGRVLLVSGEETREQIRERADRVGVSLDRLLFADSLDVSDLMNDVMQARARLLVVDSVQYVDDRRGSGTTVQRRFEALEKLLQKAKRAGVSLLLLSQVNDKGQASGGPRVKHIPDACISIEAVEGGCRTRLSVDGKNRFGPRDVSVELLMTERGFQW